MLSGNIKPYNYSINDKIRVEILKRDNYTCQLCFTQYLPNNKGWRNSKLAIHHKDMNGQKENANNKSFNLETLCRSCHSKLHNKNRVPITYRLTSQGFVL